MAGFPLKGRETLVFVLYSIHDVMKAEFALKDAGMIYDVIPVPKELSSDCGMALMVSCDDQEAVRELFKRNNLKIKGAFLKTADGYEVWKDD